MTRWTELHKRWLTGMLVIVPSQALCAPRLPAQGLPFHTGTAITTAFEQRGVRTFATYEVRGDLSVGRAALVLLPYAPHQRVTTMVGLPLVIKRVRAQGMEPFSNAGVGDLSLSVKWAFLARDRFAGTTRLAVVVTGVLPTGPTDARLADGTLAPRGLQIGGGAPAGGVTLVATVIRGPWGVNVDLRHMRWVRNDGFLRGPVSGYNLAVGYRTPARVEHLRTRTVQLYLEWNGTVPARDAAGDVRLPDTGGHFAYLSPGVQWVVLPQLLVEGSAQVPVIENGNGIQPNTGVRFALGFRLLFF